MGKENDSFTNLFLLVFYFSRIPKKKTKKKKIKINKIKKNKKKN